MRNNRIMAELAVERDVLLIDLYPAMRDPDVYSDAAHVKLPGMMHKAQIVFEAILPRVREEIQ